MSSFQVLKREQSKNTNCYLNLTAYTYTFNSKMSPYSFYKSTIPLLIYQVLNRSDSYNHYLKRHYLSQCNVFNVSKVKLKTLLTEK